MRTLLLFGLLVWPIVGAAESTPSAVNRRKSADAIITVVGHNDFRQSRPLRTEMNFTAPATRTNDPDASLIVRFIEQTERGDRYSFVSSGSKPSQGWVIFDGMSDAPVRTADWVFVLGMKEPERPIIPPGKSPEDRRG